MQCTSVIAVHDLYCVGVVRGDGGSDDYKRWVVIKWKEGKNRRIFTSYAQNAKRVEPYRREHVYESDKTFITHYDSAF